MAQKRVKVFLAAILALLMLFSPVSAYATEPTTSPSPSASVSPLKDEQIEAGSAILAEADSGKVLFEKNADAKRYPASITKIMTALLVLENCDLNEQVTVTAAALDLPGDSSAIYISEGEVLTVEQLLYGLLLKSGNDAANALGIHVAGTLKDFVAMMNTRAIELGMEGTHYANAHGLHDEEHYTTARDMLTLTRAAFKIDKFREIVSTPRYMLPPNNKREESTTWKNSNRLISTDEDEKFRYEYATGVKTGYTSAAQHTLVSSASRDGMDLIAVTLKDTTEGKWNDSIRMFTYGFHYYKSLDVETLLEGKIVKTTIQNAASDDLYGGEMVFTLVPDDLNTVVDTSDKINYILEHKDEIVIVPDKNLDALEAPLQEGVVVARFNATLDGETLVTGALKTSRAISNIRNQDMTGDPTNVPQEPVTSLETDWPLIALGIFGCFLLFVLIVSIVRTVRIKRRKRRLRQVANRRRYR